MNQGNTQRGSTLRYRSVIAAIPLMGLIPLTGCGGGPPDFAEDDLILKGTKSCGEGPPSPCYEGFAVGATEAQFAWQATGREPEPSSMAPRMEALDEALTESTDGDTWADCNDALIDGALDGSSPPGCLNDQTSAWFNLFPDPEDREFAYGYRGGWYWVVSGAG